MPNPEWENHTGQPAPPAHVHACCGGNTLDGHHPVCPLHLPRPVSGVEQASAVMKASAARALNGDLHRAMAGTKPSPEPFAHWFTYHPPVGDQLERYQQVREAAHAFAATVVRCCPPGADLSAAIRHIREAVMTANAGIACEAPAADHGAAGLP